MAGGGGFVGEVGGEEAVEDGGEGGLVVLLGLVLFVGGEDGFECGVGGGDGVVGGRWGAFLAVGAAFGVGSGSCSGLAGLLSAGGLAG